MTPYIFGIAGRSGAGKTALVERLLPELVRRGHRVGTFKHEAKGHEREQMNGDSRRLRRAGAAATVLTGPNHLAFFRLGAPPDPESLVSLLGDVDLILAEGYEGASWPKLEVHDGAGPFACAGDPWLMAVVGPKQPRRCPVPWYHCDEIVQIANLIEDARSLGLAGGTRAGQRSTATSKGK